MNRLIIVGNGFDLAHGLNTSYCHFITWYFKRCLKSACENHANGGKHSDKLLSLKYDSSIRRFNTLKFKSDDELIDHYTKEYNINDLVNQGPSPIDNIPYNFDKSPFVFNSSKTSIFFKDIIKQIDNKRWVDIELIYYERLKDILGKKNIKGDPLDNIEKEKLIDKLNSEMEFISDQLVTYLKTIEVGSQYDSILNKIYKPIDPNEFVFDIKKEKKNNPESDIDKLQKIRILNFNYTSTVNQYLFDKYNYYNPSFANDINIINIHGTIKDHLINPVVFGFGDELDEDYKTMENSKISGYFKNAKSFAYFQNHSYSDLVRFIQSDKFQVFIFGHSCGLSDRTLLNMIFEDDNCLSIKIFYKNGDEGTYRETTEEISRQFRDKVKMRNRVVNFKLSEPLVD